MPKNDLYGNWIFIKLFLVDVHILCIFVWIRIFDAPLLQRDNRRWSNIELFHEQTAGRFGSCCHPSPMIFRGSFWAKMSAWHLEEHFSWSKKFMATLVIWLWTFSCRMERGDRERPREVDTARQIYICGTMWTISKFWSEQKYLPFQVLILSVS